MTTPDGSVPKAFCYLRVSGLGQRDGDGYDRQLEACQEYASSHYLEIAEVFRECMTGTSDMEDRPQLAALLAALEENGIKTVLVEKIDRVARDLLVQETIIGDMQRRGFTVISTMEPDLCSTDPSRVLVRQIFGAIAQYDRSIIVAKMNAARKRKRDRGERAEGLPCYGERPGEAECLARMKELKAAGLKLKQIVSALTAEGYTARSGKNWTIGSLHRILSR
jgi:DNA invertase Pin-like site-specific DNA recombinase